MNRTQRWIAFESLMTARMAVNRISAPFCRQQSGFGKRLSVIPRQHRLAFRQP